MKKKQITRASIILWSIILVIAIAALSVCAVTYQNGGFSNMFHFGFHEDYSNYVTVKEEIVTETVDEIRFNWVSGHATLYKTTEDTIRIVQKAASGFPEDQRYHYDVNNGVLKITDVRKNVWNFFSWGRRESNLELYLPDRVYKALSGSTASCDVTADPFQIDTLRMESASGDITMSGAFQSVTINTVSGGVFLQNSTADTFGVGTTSGDIRLEASTAVNFDIGTTSGDISLDGCKLSGQLVAHSMSGEIRGQNVTSKDLRTNTVSGDIRLFGEFSTLSANTTSGGLAVTTTQMLRNADMNTVSGDVQLFLPENDGFTVQFNKVSGDFHCQFPTTQSGNGYVYKDGSVPLTFSTTSGDFSIKKAS